MERVRTALGWTVVIITLVVLTGTIAVFAVFSVSVAGDSMQPTLKTGDRLFLNFTTKDDVQRFDLVDASESKNVTVVKRVIGLPGDTIQVTGGLHPEVLVTPAGSDTTYRVENTAWVDQIGDATSPCCHEDGTSLLGANDPVAVVVPANSYWVIGDNWGGSTDSRAYGFIEGSNINGTLNFQIQPFSEFGMVPNPASWTPVNT